MGISKKKNFWKSKPAEDLNPWDQSKETLEMLEKMEKLFKEKASQEVAKANEFARAKDKGAAIQYLKSKRLYEPQIEHLGNLQLRMQDQMLTLGGGKAAAQTLDALITGAAALKAMNINDVDDIMYNINEQHETTKQMIEAVAAPFGAAALFDEDELEAEYAELEGAELKEPHPVPAATASAAEEHVIAGLLAAPHIRQGTHK